MPLKTAWAVMGAEKIVRLFIEPDQQQAQDDQRQKNCRAQMDHRKGDRAAPTTRRAAGQLA